MPTSVVMPQMGESIAEGTIVRWLKKVGDAVDRDEPLFEISTDKVDAEIPAPAAGTLLEIRAREGDTVAVNSIVALIAQEGEATAAVAPGGPTAAAGPARKDAPQAAPQGPPAQAVSSAASQGEPAAAGGQRRTRSSPLVRRIAREHGVDVSRIAGTGLGGRVNKRDILEHIERVPSSASGSAAAQASLHAPADHAQHVGPAGDVEVVPMTVMRRRIAEHMVASRKISAHVHTVFEVDFSVVDDIRRARKGDYERAGAKLTYLSFIMAAVTEGLRAMPVLNASIDGENVVYRKDVNLGIAVALEWGLIVPVIHQAQDKNLLGLSRAAVDLADRARAKQLKPEDVQGGTFTITNPGGSGAMFGLPIINQPQVAILCVGAVEKRVVVVDDAIGVRPMSYLTLGFDHRLVDGAVADQFMAHVKRTLEAFDHAAA